MAELIERNVIKSLVESYNEKVEKFETDLELFSQFNPETIRYAFTGKTISEPYSDDRKTYGLSDLFDKEYLVRSLKRDYWQQAIDLTGVKSSMPTKRLKEWNEMIKEGDALPDFTFDTVRSTLFDFFNSRRRYMAEKVDGVLKALSPNHKTNKNHDQLGARFIIENIIDRSGFTSWEKCGYIDDLRDVIQQLAGHISYNQRYSSRLIDYLHTYNSGQWQYVDGNVMRIRVYKKGTVHVELHPELLEELCVLLLELYPMQISSGAEMVKVRKEFKDYEYRSNSISQYAASCMSGKMRPKRNMLRDGYRFNNVPDREQKIKDTDAALAQHRYNFEFESYDISKETMEEVANILKSIGVSYVKCRHESWFGADYNFTSLVKEISFRGYIDDYKSYQYYPTNEKLAKKLIEYATFETNHEKTLEPSAGQGGLLKFIPSNNVSYLEISSVNRKVLEEKGFRGLVGEDFLKYVGKTKDRYDRIVMNPPFSKGRAKIHVQQAYDLLNKGGNVSAIIPSSMKNQVIIKGAKHTYSEVFEDEFENATVNVVIVRIDKL